MYEMNKEKKTIDVLFYEIYTSFLNHSILLFEMQKFTLASVLL